jgi:hypothetical protein
MPEIGMLLRPKGYSERLGLAAAIQFVIHGRSGSEADA